MLRVEGIETFYGEAQALFGVDLEVASGEAVALLGRNGMGKTTTLRTICGLETPRQGRVFFDQTELTGMPTFHIARCGIGLVPEGRRCFANLTVHENLVATARPGRISLTQVHTLFPRLAERTGQFAHTLSGGEQQMLAIGRALMTNPRLLILDEATEGLAPLVRQEIWLALTALKAQGLALLIVDKSLKELLPLADRCTILERGRSTWTGPSNDLDEQTKHQKLGL